MAQVPRQISTGTVSTGTTGPRIGDVDSFTKTSKALQQTGQVLGTISQNFKELETLRAVSKSTVETNRQLTELEARLLADPNLTESFAVQYEREAAQIIDEQIKTIPDERARIRASVSFQGSSLIRGFNVKKQGRDRDVQNFGVEKAEVAKDTLETAFKANENERELIRENYKIYLSENLMFSDKGALEKDLADYDESLRKGRAEFKRQSYTAAAPGRTMGERIAGAKLFLEEMKGGRYSELTSDEQETEVTKATNFIERQGKVKKIEDEAKQRENYNNDFPKMMSGEITAEEISRGGLAGRYDRILANATVAHLESFNSPVADSKNNVEQEFRIRAQQLGLEGHKKQIMLDANGNEIEGGTMRADGTEKGLGYFGAMKSSNNSFATEASIGVGIDGKEVQIPLITPDMSAEELSLIFKALQAGEEGLLNEEATMMTDIINKATEHAKKRISAGKSPFAEEGEQVAPPAGIEPVAITLGERDYTEQENLADILRTTNGNFSAGKASTLMEKSFKEIEEREKAMIKGSLDALNDRILTIAFSEEFGGDIQSEFAAKGVSSTVDLWVKKAMDRIDAIENPTKEQIKEIEDEVFEQWKTTPVEEGGAGLPAEAGAITLTTTGIVKRVFGKDSDAPAPIDLRTKKKKK
jgi:hypothetical protein